MVIDPTVMGRNYWLESVSGDLTPRAALSESKTVDVAIMGGGFSGLWTAYYLKRLHPTLDVAVVEQEICGFGASGRNGGWISPRYPSSIADLVTRAGEDEARRTQQALYDTADEITRICALEGIETDYRPNGVLTIARGERQRATVKASFDHYQSLDLGDRNIWLTADELRDRVKVSGASGAFFTDAGGTLNPAKLVRGLARAAERAGVVIYENTAVKDVLPGGRLMLESGELLARNAVVVAAEAYISQLARYRRTLLPISSSIILTEPLSADQWAAIGWVNGEGLSSQALTSNYLTKTADGRILYGSRGVPYFYNSRIDDSVFAKSKTYNEMYDALLDWFPVLKGTKVDYAWGGYLGIPRDWAPTVTFDPQTKIGTLFGYTGRGVATSNLAARLLVGLITGEDSGAPFPSTFRMASPKWEPEPLRWLGVRYVQEAFQRIDQAESGHRRPPIDTRIAKTLSGL